MLIYLQQYLFGFIYVGIQKVTLKVPVGEIVRSIVLPEKMFDEEQLKLRGMTEHVCNINIPTNLLDARNMSQKVFECVNVASIKAESANTYKFAGQTLSSKCLVLITIKMSNSDAKIIVNCEKMIIGSMLLNEIKSVMQWFIINNIYIY